MSAFTMTWCRELKLTWFLCFVPSSSLISGKYVDSPPNVLFILADDMGWNDVSFHGSDQIPTPNIDALAYNGVILNRHYTQPLCTPSRASLMTGKYAVHTGLHDAFTPTQRAGLSLSEKIMPQYFKELGYSTHLVGKWHLGFYRKEFTPLQRGFDSHFGYWSGAVSYYDHIDENPLTPNSRLNYSGHDMRRGYISACDVVGQYATDLFTEEAINVIQNHDPDRPMFMFLAHLATHAGNQGKWLEAPQAEINKFSYISDPNRRSYAAMVSKLDKSVGEVVSALDKRRMLKNSIIVFLSDNGAMDIGQYNNWGSNYPWRGQKATLWEGGVRTPSLVWSPLIVNPSRVSYNLMHITDWLPTLLTAAGHKGPTPDIDGVNQWEAISRGRTEARHELVVDIDDENDMAAMIFRSYKYLKGPARKRSSPEVNKFLNTETIVSPRQPPYDISGVTQSPAWRAIQKHTRKPGTQYKIPQLRSEATVVCKHDFNKQLNCSGTPCLFNIFEDPCEQNDVANEFPQLVNYIEKVRLNEYRVGAVTVLVEEDPASNPGRFNGDWSIWVV